MVKIVRLKIIIQPLGIKFIETYAT